MLSQLVAESITETVSARCGALARLLSAEPTTPARLSTARKIAKSQSALGQLPAAAFKLLAASPEARDRPLLLKVATHPGLGLPERLSRIDALGELSRLPERRAAKEALTEVTAYPGVVDTSVLGRLASRLDQKWVADWIMALSSTDLTRVMTADFGRELSPDLVLDLVGNNLSSEQVLAFYTVAYGLSWEDDAAVAERLVAAGHALPDGADRYLLDRDGMLAVREESWTVLLADTSGNLASAFARAASASDVVSAAEKHKAHPAAAMQFAELAVRMCSRMGSPDSLGRVVPDGHWTSMLVALTGTLGQRLLGALAAHIRTIVTPSPVLDQVLVDAETTIAFVRGGAGAEVVSHATQPAVAARLLASCAQILTDGDVETLLSTVGTSDLELMAEALDSAALGHAGLLQSRAHRLVDGLTDPIQPQRPDPLLVDATLRVAMKYGLADEIDSRTLSRVRILLDHRRPELVEVGCVWATKLHPDVSDLETLVRGVVDIDDRRANRHSSLSELRAHLARTLVQQSREVSRPIGERANALRLSAVAESDLAYTAAIELAGNEDAALNLAAAEVLGAATVHPKDIPVLQALFDAETDVSAREFFGQALTRINAKAANDALTRLLDLTGEAAAPSIIAAVAPRDGTDAADRLVHCVNEVLQSNSAASMPTAFVMAATSLADEFMYSAIVAAADAGNPIAAVATEKIRVRSEGNAGNIAGRQPVLERMPWVANVLTLHNLRQGHATKKGQPRPAPLVEKDRSNARTLLGMVLIGWLDTMHSLSSEGGDCVASGGP